MCQFAEQGSLKHYFSYLFKIHFITTHKVSSTVQTVHIHVRVQNSTLQYGSIL